MLEGLHPVSFTLFYVLSPSPLPAGRQHLNQGRFSGSRICLLSAPSHLIFTRQWPVAEVVPGYSGGTAPEFNGIPY